MTESDRRRTLLIMGAVLVAGLALVPIGLALPRLEPLLFVLLFFGIIAAGIALQRRG